MSPPSAHELELDTALYRYVLMGINIRWSCRWQRKILLREGLHAARTYSLVCSALTLDKDENVTTIFTSTLYPNGAYISAHGGLVVFPFRFSIS